MPTPCPFPLRLCRASTRGGLLLSLRAATAFISAERFHRQTELCPGLRRHCLAQQEAALATSSRACVCLSAWQALFSTALLRHLSSFTSDVAGPPQVCSDPFRSILSTTIQDNLWILHIHPVRPGEGRAPAARQEGRHGEPPAPAGGQQPPRSSPSPAQPPVALLAPSAADPQRAASRRAGGRPQVLTEVAEELGSALIT